MTDATPRARDDTAAIAAYGARYGLDAEAAAADWRFLTEGDREHFREVADGNAPAGAEPETGACPHGDLAAEITRLRARAEAADAHFRDVLESLRRRDGLPLGSAVVPGEPARNYELADRLGIGRIFGLQQGEIRTCYCGTTATVMPGVFPHPDCDGSVRRQPQRIPTPGQVVHEAWRGEVDKHRTRLAMLLADTPFEFRPDWEHEYDDVAPKEGLVAPPAEPEPAPALAPADDGRDAAADARDALEPLEGVDS